MYAKVSRRQGYQAVLKDKTGQKPRIFSKGKSRTALPVC
jgi:hypothetical protein